MARMACVLRYDGSRYHGWQTQDDELPTIQSRLELALSSVANHPVSVQCAGRTDAGVHASAQVVHFDVDTHRSNHAWVFGANANLPPDIRVLWVDAISDTFHARFSATARTYRYILHNHPIRPGIARHFVGWYHRELDIDLMRQAAHLLCGEHDFSAFRGSGCQANHAVRTISSLSIERQRTLIILSITANAFLLHMVRNIVGSLLQVGTADRDVSWFEEVLASKDRNLAGVTISPNGLYLVNVAYPDQFSIPPFPMGPFFLPG